MFGSKKRDVVIPQSEHLQLVGRLAFLWGNETFSQPPVNRNAFILSNATHDRVFGFLDTDELGLIDDNRRKEQVETWLNTSYKDHHTELLILLHVRRLMDDLERIDLYQKIDERIQTIVNENNIDVSRYLSADTITQFCDLIAFDFCFESSATRTQMVFQSENEQAEITYSIEDGIITVNPWPFSVPEYNGYILGYERTGYPNNLQPVLIDFKITQSSK